MIDIKKLENVILKKYYHSYVCCLYAYWNMIEPETDNFTYYYKLLSYMEKRYPKRKYIHFIEIFSKMKDTNGINILIDLFKHSNKLNSNVKRRNALNSIEKEDLINYVFNFI